MFCFLICQPLIERQGNFGGSYDEIKNTYRGEAKKTDEVENHVESVHYIINLEIIDDHCKIRPDFPGYIGF